MDSEELHERKDPTHIRWCWELLNIKKKQSKFFRIKCQTNAANGSNTFKIHFYRMLHKDTLKIILLPALMKRKCKFRKF